MLSYNEFIIKESSNHVLDDEINGNVILSSILSSLEPMIQELIDKYDAISIEEGGKVLTNFQKMCVRLGLIYDLVKSVEKYTKSDDKLLDIKTSRSQKGSLEINSHIERDGVSYPFHTEVIYAGGYNIQRLHYRYITKTKLPQTNNDEYAKLISNKIKKLTKIEKFQDEIISYKKRISDNEELIKKSLLFSDDDILDILKKSGEYSSLYNITWETLSDESHYKLNGTREEWEKSQDDFIKSRIKFWKDKNIGWKQVDNNRLNLSISKIQKKIDELLK